MVTNKWFLSLNEWVWKYCKLRFQTTRYTVLDIPGTTLFKPVTFGIRPFFWGLSTMQKNILRYLIFLQSISVKNKTLTCKHNSVGHLLVVHGWTLYHQAALSSVKTNDDDGKDKITSNRSSLHVAGTDCTIINKASMGHPDCRLACTTCVSPCQFR